MRIRAYTIFHDHRFVPLAEEQHRAAKSEGMLTAGLLHVRIRRGHVIVSIGRVVGFEQL